MAILGAIGLDLDTVVANLFSSAGTGTIVAGGGRTSGSASYRSANTVTLQTLSTPLSTLFVAFAIKPTTITTGLSPLNLFDGGTVQVGARLVSDGTLQVYRGTSANILGSSSIGAVSTGIYQHIEIGTVINASSGSMQVWVNSVSVVSASNINTKNTSNLTVSQFNIAASATADTIDTCDIVYGTSRIGDRRVECLMPTGSGFYTQFTASGSNANWQNVKEVPSDGDTSYNNTANTGSIDCFTHATMSQSPLSVDAVIVNVRSRNTTVGAGNVAPFLRSAGVDISGSDTTLNTSYQSTQLVYLVDPATSAAWTPAAANAAQIGYKKTL